MILVGMLGVAGAGLLAYYLMDKYHAYIAEAESLASIAEWKKRTENVVTAVENEIKTVEADAITVS